MAFVSVSPLGVRNSTISGNAVTKSTRTVSCRGKRAVVRASIQEENKKAKEAAEFKGIQGFTAYSEKVNGRMAMLGFTIGLMTEIINPAHPTFLAQVESAFDFIPFVHNLTL